MTHRVFRSRPTRRGQVTVIFAAGILTFLGCLALVVDVGIYYAAKAQLQTAADIALLSSFAQVDPFAAYEEQERSLLEKVALFEQANFGSTAGTNLRVAEAGAQPWDLFEVTVYMDPATRCLAKAEAKARIRLDTAFARLFGQETVDIPVWSVVTGRRAFKDGKGVMSARLVE